jgi:RimJ/RimL family protein N-acetyltransferase
MLPLPLITPRLRIDRLVADDAAALAAYRNDELVARWQSWSRPYGPERAASSIAAMADDTPGVPGHQVNLALRAEAALAGDVYVHVLAGAPHVVELGITLARGAQGTGLATEAVTAVVDAFFAGGDVVIRVEVLIVVVGQRKENDKRDVYRLAQRIVELGLIPDDDENDPDEPVAS